MGEPVSITASIFSGLNTVVRAISLVAHYKEVPKEVKQLHANIEKAEKSVNIAKRLLRSKGHYLDPRLVKETQDSIEATNSVLLLVRDSIEACRKDLELQETVTLKNRIAWVLWKNQEFLSQLQTLGNWLHALDRDILRLEMALPPVVFINGSPAPPTYADSSRGQDNVNGIGEQLDTDLNQKPPFPRSLTKRLRLSSNTSSKVDLNKRAVTEEDAGGLLPRTKDGDEGYESDESIYRSLSRSSPALDDHRSEEIRGQTALFTNDTIGIDTSGLGLSISQGHLNTHQVHFLRQALITSTSTIPNILELPGSYTTQQAQEIPTLISHPLSSNNPWRKLTTQPSRSTLSSVVDSHQDETPLHFPDIDSTGLTTTNISTLVDDRDDTANNLLRLSVTAPAAPLATRQTEASKSPETDWKKPRWRRKSDFI